MAGLLDFVQSPEGQGLLSAAFGGLAAARRGQPLNTIGAAGMSGLMGYQGAQQFQSDQEMRKQQIEAIGVSNGLHKLQTDKLTRDLTKQQKIEGLAPQFYVPGQSAAEVGLGEGAQVGDIGPTTTNAARAATAKPRAGWFDSAGYMEALSRIDPMEAVNLSSAMRKAGHVTLKDGEQVYDTSGKLLFGNDPKMNLTYHPGDGYRPDTVFNTRTGEAMPMGGQRPPQTGGFQAPQPAPQPGPVAQQPPAIRAPWDGMPAKEADQFKQRVYDQESKKLDDLRAEVAKGRATLQDLERFGELNRARETGGIQDRFGFLPTFDKDKREMEAITARLAPTMRAPGSGASSDRDVSLFLSGLPSIDKEGNVNRNIREQFAGNVAKAEQKMAAAERYLLQNGHLNGFEEGWKAQQQPKPAAQGGKVVVARGVYGGRKVLKYSDGSVSYAD